LKGVGVADRGGGGRQNSFYSMFLFVDSFIGEESAVEGSHCDLTDNPTWIIDPVDGTTNFVHK